MNDTVSMTIRMNRSLKARADALFEELGMNMTTAFNVFVRQAVREQGLPFSVTREVPNAETRAAMEEARAIAEGRIPAKHYDSAAALVKDALR